MPKASASVSDRLEKLENRLDSIEKLLRPPTSVIVAWFILACLDPVDGAETSAVDIFRRYERWCREHYPLVEPLDIQAFAEQFAHRCRKTNIEARHIETLHYVNVAIA